MIDVDRSLKLINRRGRYQISINKPYDYANTEQYKSNKEQHPEFSPGPQQYWKSKGGDTNERPKDLQEEISQWKKCKGILYEQKKNRL